MADSKLGKSVVTVHATNQLNKQIRISNTMAQFFFFALAGVITIRQLSSDLRNFAFATSFEN